MITLPQHAIFKRFKSPEFRPNLLICFPPAAGGNFVASLIAGLDDEKKISANEYRLNGFHCPFDSMPLTEEFFPDEQRLVDYLDTLVHVAPRYSPKELVMGDMRIALSHNLPLLTHAIYEMHSDEIIVIEPDSMSRRFIWMLELCKLNMQTDYGEKPHLINQLLNLPHDYGVTTNIPQDAWLHALTLLNDEPYLNLIWNSLLMWRYIVNCHGRGCAITRDSLRQFMDDTIMGHMHHEIWHRQYHAEALQKLRKHTDRMTVISYGDLFFAGRLPVSGHLSGCDHRKILEYSAENVALVAKLLPLLSDENRVRITAYLAVLEDRIRQGIARLS